MGSNTLPRSLEEKLNYIVDHVTAANLANKSTNRDFAVVMDAWLSFERTHTSRSLHDRIWRLKMACVLRMLANIYIRTHITQDDTPGSC